jgi:serine/threonine-protein kinase
MMWAFKRDYGKAIADCDAWIRLEPKNMEAFLRRGNLRKWNKDYDGAIADFDHCLLVDPKNADALESRGDTKRYAHDYEGAIADYDDCLLIDPKSADVWKARGHAKRYAGRYKDALADYQELLRIDPRSPDANEALAWIWATCPERSFRDGDKAVEYAKKACELDKWKSGMLIATLAAAHAETGDFDEAIKWQKKVVEKAPDDRCKAWAQRRLELFERGLPYRENPNQSADEGKNELADARRSFQRVTRVAAGQKRT